jgi:bacteriocin-like protein
MSEENKKTEKIEQPAELSEKELDNIAGGDAASPKLYDVYPSPAVGPITQITNTINTTLTAAGVKGL